MLALAHAGHKLSAVRQRTLQNLLFKVKHGLSPDASQVPQLCLGYSCNISDTAQARRTLLTGSQDTAFLENLLLWFQHENGDASDCVMLDLLCTLTQHPGVSVKLCSLGLPPILDELCNRSSPEVKRSAHKTLTALLQSDSACFSHASSQHLQQLSPHDPRSRCQSNSPAIGKQHQLPRSQQAPGVDRQWLHKPIKKVTPTRLSSHAFGSQQGKS